MLAEDAQSKDIKKINNFDVEWQRWFRGAILKSMNQILGAERWISQYPERIFLDRQCTQKLPIDLPQERKRRIHRVIIALGAGEICREFYGSGSGSLMICPSIKGTDHCCLQPPCRPFTIGDINPDGGFIHVFDDVTLDIVLRELDTVTDFVLYLERKEEFIRSGHLIAAAGEEELLAHYLTHINKDKEHDFMPLSGNAEWKDDECIVLTEDHWTSMSTNPQYIAKKTADRISYFWDDLINKFTEHMLAGTSVTREGNFDVREHEHGGVRYMALEPRVRRRLLSQGILDAIEKCPPGQRFFRCIMPSKGDHRNEIPYVFLQLPHPDPERKPAVDYETYRKVRSNTLYAYCMAVKMENPFLERIIGIAMEPPKYYQKAKTSEDLLMMAPEEWTENLQREAAELCKVYDILRKDRIQYTAYHVNEYPEMPRSSMSSISEGNEHVLNRKQRRALKKGDKKRKRDKKRK